MHKKIMKKLVHRIHPRKNILHKKNSLRKQFEKKSAKKQYTKKSSKKIVHKKNSEKNFA